MNCRSILGRPGGGDNFQSAQAVSPSNDAIGPIENTDEKSRSVNPPDLAVRMHRAHELALAIGAAHPDDARAILTAALIDHLEGMPPHAVFLSARDDARFWASVASEIEITELLSACLREIPRRSLHLNPRKRLLAALFESMPNADRASFLAWAKGGGQC